jgi:uncharacterized protein YlxW (UPF0749 family)
VSAEIPIGIGASETHVEVGPPSGELTAHGDHGWVWQLTALSVILGMMLATAVRTTEHIQKLGLPSIRGGAAASALSHLRERSQKLEKTAAELQAKVDDYRANLSDGGKSSKLLQEQVAESRAMAGFAPVHGQGLEIELDNSPLPVLAGTENMREGYLVSFDDVNGLVSELLAAGAEAIAVGGRGARTPERFVISTVVRPAEHGIVINGTPLQPPYRILAIGNAKNLRSALEMPEGIIVNKSLVLLRMIKIKESRDLVLPAYRHGGADHPAPAHQ